MELGVCDGVWPVIPQYRPKAVVLEDLQLLVYGIGHLQRF